MDKFSVLLARELFQHNTMYESTIKCMFFISVFAICHATLIPVDHWTATTTHLGPVIKVFCEGGKSDYRWLFANKTLAENNELIDADSTRYSVSVKNISRYQYGSLLSIRNALREDAGWYKCQVEFYSNSKFIQRKSKVFVPVQDYLPSLSYPKCLISPSLTLFDNSYAIFSCTTGAKSSSVSLSLTLQYQNGYIVELGHDAVTKTVTLNDNNAMFICHMTSAIFPTAYRNCSAGPIIVQEMLAISTKVTKIITSPVMTVVVNPTKGHNLSETGSKMKYYIYGIIIGIAAFLLVISGSLVCFITLRKSVSQETNPVHMSAIRNSNGVENPPNQEDSSDVTSRQDTSQQIPVYAEVQEPSSQNLREDIITYTYADTNLSTIPEETMNFLKYSEAKETATDKSKNEANDEYSTGMVENTTYVSSGPV